MGGGLRVRDLNADMTLLRCSQYHSEHRSLVDTSMAAQLYAGIECASSTSPVAERMTRSACEVRAK
jgi:hypothetical protein